MEKAELIYLATLAFEKNMDYEKLMYSDHMYDNEDQTDEVWEYVKELKNFGRIAFYEKYKEFKLYIP